MKIIKGSNCIIKPGIYKLVRNNGVKIDASESLKNSISSNKFNTIPKQ